MEFVEVNGKQIPALGLGTYSMKGEDCREACLTAFEMGYRHVDTAQMYDNEKPVGNAIQNSNIPRKDFFVVTKILRSNLSYDDLLSSFEQSLSRLGLEYVDLLLIHAPSRAVPVEESLKAMNELQADGAVDHVGVSNFSIEQTREAVKASETPILTNQVKYHPLKDQSELLAFCIEQNIMLTAHTPLARMKISNNDTLCSIGEGYDKSPAQITLRWLVQQPMVSAIPKSSNPDHQEENLEIFDFELSDREMEEIAKIGGGWFESLKSLIDLS